jgi:hypothetical protein
MTIEAIVASFGKGIRVTAVKCNMTALSLSLAALIH